MNKKALKKAKWLYEVWECPIENCPRKECRRDRCIKIIAKAIAKDTPSKEGQ